MSVIQCFSLFLSRDKLTLKTDAPDGIEQGRNEHEKNAIMFGSNCWNSGRINGSQFLYLSNK